MANDPIKEMPQNEFDAWAAHMGIDADLDHLERLYPEAAALLRRTATSHTTATDAANLEEVV